MRDYSSESPWSARAAKATSVSPVLARHRDRILAVATRYGADNVRVFGSHARGEAGVRSDLDLLVDFADGRTLLDHVGLWQELEELLDCHVDVVITGGISRYLEDRILAEAVPL